MKGGISIRKPLKWGDVISFRLPMLVCEAKMLAGTTWAVCPRCKLTLEREYMAYCDRCGQCLKWKKFLKMVYVVSDTAKFL